MSWVCRVLKVWWPLLSFHFFLSIRGLINLSHSSLPQSIPWLVRSWILHLLAALGFHLHNTNASSTIASTSSGVSLAISCLIDSRKNRLKKYVTEIEVKSLTFTLHESKPFNIQHSTCNIKIVNPWNHCETICETNAPLLKHRHGTLCSRRWRLQRWSAWSSSFKSWFSCIVICMNVSFERLWKLYDSIYNTPSLNWFSCYLCSVICLSRVA